MLGNIRSIIRSKVGAALALLLLGLIAFAFALGDISGTGSFGGVGGGNVAQVGDEKIGIATFTDAVQNAYRAARQEQPTLDIASFVRQGGLDGTLTRLLNSYVTAAFGAEHGMSVSQAMVDAQIRQLPGTTGLDGSFDQAAFQRMLADAKVTEQMLRADFTRNLYTEQLLTLAASGNAVTEGYAVPYGNMVLEKRSGEMAFIPAAAFVPANPPSDAELAAYYRSNATTFSLPEQRAVKYAVFTDTAVGTAGNVNEKDIADYYNANRDEFAANETRAVAQLIIPSEPEARSIAAKAAAGTSLDQLATVSGRSVIRTGQLTSAALATQSSPEVARAAFAGQAEEIAPVAKGKLGWYVTRIESIVRNAGRTLAEAQPAIVELLASAKREEAIADMTAGIEEAIDDGTSVEEIAKTYRLTTATTPLLIASGKAIADPAYQPAADLAGILSVAFDLDPEGEARLVEIERGVKFALVSVDAVREAAPPPLAAVKPLVIQEWALAKGVVEAGRVAESVRQQVAKGTPLAQAVTAVGKNLPPPQTMSGTRAELVQGQNRVPPPLAMMFAMAENSVKTLKAPQNRGWFVVRLITATPGDAKGNAPLLLATRQQLSRSVASEFGAQFLNAMAKDVSIARNDKAIADVRKRLLGDN